MIGGLAADAGNSISGNTSGILIFEPQSHSTQVLHNKIGTNVYGTLALPNEGNGIQIQRASQIEVAGNLISGNSGTGIYVEGPNAAAITIEDNLIGTDVTGTNRLGNGTGGIDMVDARKHRAGQYDFWLPELRDRGDHPGSGSDQEYCDEEPHRHRFGRPH